jgi:hypothetical protein
MLISTARSKQAAARSHATLRLRPPTARGSSSLTYQQSWSCQLDPDFGIANTPAALRWWT